MNWLNLVGYLGGITVALLLPSPLRWRRRRPAHMATPAWRLPDPVIQAEPEALPPWEDDRFYREAPVPITDARRAIWRRRERYDPSDEEADSFVEELHQVQGVPPHEPGAAPTMTDEDYLRPEPISDAGDITVDSIRAWGEQMEAYIRSWGEEEQPEVPRALPAPPG